MPDPSERDLAAHLETALRGILLAERWPKSGVDVIITVLEGDEESHVGPDTRMTGDWSAMNILSGCITVASAAIADAGIDCIDLVTGGVAAFASQANGRPQLVLDPCPTDHESVDGACVVAYLQSRDEITEIWARDERRTSPPTSDTADLGALVDNAVEAASAARLVLVDALQDATEEKIRKMQASEAVKAV